MLAPIKRGEAIFAKTLCPESLQGAIETSNWHCISVTKPMRWFVKALQFIEKINDEYSASEGAGGNGRLDIEHSDGARLLEFINQADMFFGEALTAQKKTTKEKRAPVPCHCPFF